MAEDIPSDDKAHNKLVQKVQLRYLRSRDYYDDYRLKFERFERWWNQVEDGAKAGDENCKRLGYAFGLVERMHAKITEPLFMMGLPWSCSPRHMKDYRSAQNMEQIGRNFYANPNQQLGISLSKKSMCIIGHRWEFDGWKQVVRPGKRWGLVEAPVKVEEKDPKTGKMRTVAKGVEMVPSEVPCEVPVHLGFDTEYPDWRDILPEPFRTTIDTGARTDLTWVIRDLGYLTLEELAREKYTDAMGRSQNLYDLTRLLHAYGKRAKERYEKILAGGDGVADNFGAIVIPERFWDYEGRSPNYHHAGHKNLAEAQTLEDRDKVWVCQHRENGEILTIAQGRFVIHRKLDPYHTPGLKCRIENYTTRPNSLYGKGAIEPLEAEFGQLDDMHELGMQNIFRLVNKMLYIREDAIVSEDDFDPRAGGRIRIKSDQADVRSVVADASQNSPIGEMISVESELRGLIEFVSMELDGAPGVMGTKQEHKTKGGQAQIIANMAPSFSRFQRQARINECLRAKSMAEFFAQFAFKKMPYRLYRPDGSTGFAEFDRTDIDTEGRGFDFTFDMDPMWGSLDQKKQLRLEMFKEALAYAQLPPQVRGENSRVPNLDQLFEDVLRSGGYSDLSNLFRFPDGALSPEQELEALAQGRTDVECKGDLMHHVTTHLLQIQSPWLEGAIKAGKAHPDTQKNLQALTQQAAAKLRAFAANPMAAAQEKLAKSGMTKPAQGMQ